MSKLHDYNVVGIELCNILGMDVKEVKKLTFVWSATEFPEVIVEMSASRAEFPYQLLHHFLLVPKGENNNG